MPSSKVFTDYIQSQEQMWLEKFLPHLDSSSKTLKVGNGLGHLTEAIRPHVKELVVLDIETYAQTINKDKVQIYDGFPIPFSDKTFDTTVIVFTLHHIPKSQAFFQEILRVTKNRVILIEETYDNFFQKVHLYYRDWVINRRAGQSCKLYWSSYFSRKDLDNLIVRNNLSISYQLEKKHKSYFKELFILDFK